MMAYHEERLLNLSALKHKAQNLANNIQTGDLSKVSFGHIPSNFRQSQKSINESNYSSEPMLANVKFN
jgi:phage head maturation protease